MIFFKAEFFFFFFQDQVSNNSVLSKEAMHQTNILSLYFNFLLVLFRFIKGPYIPKKKKKEEKSGIRKQLI